MPQLRAFRGLRYDPRRVSAAAVLCPPYDIISVRDRADLAERDPHNAVHVELPAGPPGGGEAAYHRAAALFAQWQAEGVLRRDERPLIYVYEQHYDFATAGEGSPATGEGRSRGFFCRLRLERFGPDARVRPHERTMSGPKEDRYRVLRAVNANLSPVILLYSARDQGDSPTRLLEELSSGSPALEARDDSGVRHRLWLADPAVSEAARMLLGIASAGPLTIADGHHRYETALRYRDEQADGLDERSQTPANHVMVLLYEAASGGLQVLPTHRLVRGGLVGAELLAAAQTLFRVTPCARPAELLERLHEPGRLGVWTRAGGALLEPRRRELERLLPAGASQTLRWLDVSVLSAVLPTLAGAGTDELLQSGRLSYTKDAQEAIGQVAKGAADACFLLPATPIAAVLQVAAGGEQMPEKSTYFYPKAATGLVFNPLSS